MITLFADFFRAVRRRRDPSGNAWSLIRSGDDVLVRFDYADEDDEHETVPVVDLVAGLTAYREAVARAIENGHELDGRWWAQKNPQD